MNNFDDQQNQHRHEQELAAPFLIVLSVLTIIAFLLPLRPETSIREKRKLRVFPSFTAESLLNGSYFDDITLWFSDTFPGRETMLGISDQIDSLHGLNRNEIVLAQGNDTNDNENLDALLEQAEANASSEEPIITPVEPDTVSEEVLPDPNEVVENWEGLKGEDEAAMFGDLVVIDGTAMSRMGFSQSASDHHVFLMNQAGDVLAAKGIRFFNVPAPTSISVLLSSDMLQQLGSADQGKTLRYMFAQENDNVYKVNSFNNLLAHNDEYLYYHSDHHWTALGAYYTYQEFCSVAGFEPVPLSEFRVWNMGDFYGSYFYSVNSRKLSRDEMIAYVPPNDESIHMEIAGYPKYTTVIIDKSSSEPNAKYNCFIAGDNPITIITNDRLLDAPDCLVIKDSFGNPFSVYLSQHYHHVYVLDYRKNNTPVSKVAEQYGVQDVVLVQSIGVSQTRSAQELLDILMK